jgi:ribosomal protein S18 acetylase RimI-like enzyme
MNEAESEAAAAAYREGDIGALATLVVEQEEGQLAAPWLSSYKPYALLANLAVAPAFRGCGIGRELCDFCECGCEMWGVRDVLLQVEEANGAARKLYESLGYEPIYRVEDAPALRLSPSTPSLMSSLLLTENEALLREEPSILVTMAKCVANERQCQ